MLFKPVKKSKCRQLKNKHPRFPSLQQRVWSIFKRLSAAAKHKTGKRGLFFLQKHFILEIFSFSIFFIWVFFGWPPFWQGLSVPQIANADTTTGLITYWKFNENPAIQAASTTDYSGNNNTGFLSTGDGSTNKSVNGMIGQAINFDGTNDYVYSSTSFSNPTTFTLSVWFKTTVAGGKKIIGFESNRTGGASADIDRHIAMDTSGKIQFDFYSGGLHSVTSINTLNDGLWHHAVAAHNGTSGTLYIDGVNQGWTAGGVQNYTGYWRVGSYSNSWAGGTTGYFNGQIDDVRIYNRVLTDNDVVELYNIGKAQLEQEGYRFRKDDGDEYGASWAANQDTDITWPANTNLRLRMLLNTVTDYPLDTSTYDFQLEYKKSTDSTYIKIPTTTVVATTTVTYSSKGVPNEGTDALSPAYPTVINKGDLLILTIINKYSSTSIPTDPSGWTKVAQIEGGQGGIGDDIGLLYTTVYTKEAIGDEDLTTQNLTITNGNCSSAEIFRFVRGSNAIPLSITASTGSQNTGNTTTWSIAGNANMDIRNGDVIFVVSGINGDVAQFSSETITATGTLTFGTMTELEDNANITNNDCRLIVTNHPVTGGNATGTPSYSMIATGAGVNRPAGSTVMLRIRGINPTPNIILSPSSYIDTDATASTTYQLSAPENKSTSNFTPSSISDDTNPLPDTTIESTKYTEVEWNLITTSTAAVGDIYQFRITNAGVVFDTSTLALTPQWTIGSASTPGGTLSIDIVNGANVSVASPTISLSTTSFSFAPQTATGTFGIATQKIQVNNQTTNAQWSLSIAATNGTTSVWQGASSSYNYNSATNGQMSIDQTSATSTPQAGCFNTGLTFGSSTAFLANVTNTISLVSAGATAGTNCYWDFTNFLISQTIPGSQPADTYSIDLTLTVVAV